MLQVLTPDAFVFAAVEHPEIVFPVPEDVKLAATPLIAALFPSLTVMVHVV